MKLTRKQLAAEISKRRDDVVTVRQVRYNEKAWGLRPARGKDISKKSVCYDRELALAALCKRGIIPS